MFFGLTNSTLFQLHNQRLSKKIPSKTIYLNVFTKSDA